MKYFVCAILVTFSLKSVHGNEQPVITTNAGQVRGIEQEAANGLKVDAYFGIPFAKPPSGNLRFKHPQKPEPWQGVFEANQRPNSCFQTVDEFYGTNFSGSNQWNANTNMSEDCLYLNIWVPRPRPGPGTLSVFVWIFGGGFYSGTSTLDIYDGRYIASEENIIVASMNYRVGSLGLLYLGNRSDAPGNAGMMDQVMALEWIQDNIEAFGGLKTNVSIFGESAGAASCALHMVSPKSRHLFSNVILQSASLISPWAVTETNTIEKRTLKLAELVNCPHGEDFNEVMDCLRNTYPQLLTDKDFSTDTLSVVDFPFTPIVDGEYLLEDPKVSVKNGNIKKTNLLAGSNTHEGLFFILYFFPKLFRKEENVTLTRKQFISAIEAAYANMNGLAQNAIIFEYTNWDSLNDGNINRDMIDRMVSDYNFHCPVVDFTGDYSQQNNTVYNYYYTHRYSNHPYPSWTGVLHGDEVLMIFGEPLKPADKFTPAEKVFTRRMIKYWANFAKTGNPNIGSSNPDPKLEEWLPNTPSNRQYMVLSENAKMASPGPFLKQCALWKEFIPQLNSYASECKNGPSASAMEKEKDNSSPRSSSFTFLIIVATLIYSLLIV